MLRFRRCLPALVAIGALAPAQAAFAARGIVVSAPARPAVAARAVHRPDLMDLGRATAATPVRVAIALNERNKPELERLLALQGDRRSPYFHHFLTHAQFEAEFGPSAADYRRVLATLQSAGFRVLPGSASRTIVDAVASAPAAERFFSTQIHRVAQVRHGFRYANVSDATVPSAIADVVHAVTGIDDIVRMRPANMRAVNDAASTGLAANAESAGAPLVRYDRGSFAGLFPSAIANAYQYPSLQGYTGAGPAIGIVIDSDIANFDLKTFWKSAKIERTGRVDRIYVDGGSSQPTFDLDEVAIDTEEASSLAPAADVDVYVIPDLSDASVEDAYNQAVSDQAVDVLSSSFAGCELDDTSFADATDQIAEEAAAQGITFFASTGDSGATCRDYDDASGRTYYNPDMVNTPAADPHVVAVGGTTLVIAPASGARISETAWGGPAHGEGRGGGGVSSYFALPAYQQNTAGMAVVPAHAVSGPQTAVNTGFAGRNLPDVSLDASNRGRSYVAVYFGGAWYGYGGTSVSTPMLAAYVHEINQQTGTPAGFLNPELYSLFDNSGYQTFFYDVTSGNIGGGWTAHAGYDQATGIGSITGGTF